MIRFLLTAVAVALVGLAILLVLVWRGQERIVFQPPRSPGPQVDGVERIDFQGPDGQPLLAYVVRGDDERKGRGARGSPPDSRIRPEAGDTITVSPPAAPNERDPGAPPLLLVFHGNAEIAAWGIEWAQEVASRTGATVVLAEYRGYAGLPGSPTYEGSRSDAVATWEQLRTRLGARPEGTVLYGHSLGSAVAVELAERIRPRAVLLEAPFTSARAMAARMPIPGLVRFWRVLSRVHFDTRARVAGLECPVWVAHGSRDIVIPAHMGREVHAAARVKGELLVVPGAGHNDVRAVGDEAYWRWVGTALGR